MLTMMKSYKKSLARDVFYKFKTELDHIFPSNVSYRYIPSLHNQQKRYDGIAAVQHLLRAAYLFSVTKWD